MAKFNFPNSPSTNQEYTANSVTWKWDGYVWRRVTGVGYGVGAQGYQGHQGAVGAQGAAGTGAENMFTTIAVSGQSNLVPDTTSDTLTFAAGSNVTITTNAGTDTITIAADGKLTTEEVQDIVGAMFSGNTETNITATYQDSDGTIDLVSTDTNTNTTYEISCQDGDNADEEKIRLHGLNPNSTDDIVLEAGTGLSIARSGDKITFTNTNTPETVQDIVGAMFSGNTETNITATYQDSDGTIDLVAATALTVQEEGSNLTTTANTLNFTGATITATGSGGTVTVDVTGSGSSSNTNLSYTASTRVLASSTGTDATLPEVAAGGNSGLMTGSDKTKLDGLVGLSDGDKGDISVSNSGATWTIDNDVVTYAKIQDVSTTNRLLGRDSSGSGVIEEIDPANVRSMLNVSDGANNYTHPNHTGDVTSTGDGATTIANSAVTYAKMQNVSATDRILGRDSSGAGVIEEITPASLRTMLNVSSGANNYTHPLSEVTDIDTNDSSADIVDSISTNNTGHITAMTTRTLTLSDLGYTGSTTANNYTHPTYNPGNVDTNNSTAEIIDSITTNNTGHITAMTTRTLTLANLGYTGSAGTTSVNLSGTSVQTVATIALSAQHCLDFTVHITHSSGIQACKVLLMDNGSTAYCTEYAVMYSGSSLGSFSCTTSGGNILLQFTPTNSSSTTVRYLLESVV